MKTRHFEVHGRSMPVSYRRSVEETARWFGALQPTVVLGVGVAVKRPDVTLERLAWARFAPTRPDVDGRVAAWRSGQRVRPVRLPIEAMARAAGIEVSDDCGDYVCNSWLYATLGALPEHVAVGFLHVPSSGFSVDGVERMLDAIEAGEVHRG
jgi:pyrrolidone-carboxylate peptidase